MTSIRAARVLVPDGVLTDAVVRVEDGRVAAVGGPSGPADVVLDDGVLVPGLIDLQVTGFYGSDFAAATAQEWDVVTARMPETGVTSLLPTFVSAPVPDLAAALRRTSAVLYGLSDTPRARVLGLHLEGPFLSERRSGAHDRAFLCDPTPEAVRELLDAADGLLTVVTLAPEREGALAAVQQLVAAGVLVSIGHSDADAAQVERAADAGARMVTHLFNAQSPLRHREPGVAGQALADGRLTAGLVVDLHHVAAAVCRIAFAAAAGRVVLVTDAAAPAGMPPGRYVLGGQPVVLPPDGPPRRDDGTIAGSALRLDEAVRNTVRTGVELTTAVDAATRLPADLVGRSDLGRIVPGALADLAWLGPDLRTRATWVGGELAYAAAAA